MTPHKSRTTKPATRADRRRREMSAINSRWFTRFTREAARLSGRPVAFIAAVVLIAGWAVTGPLFRFGDTWQLVINTTTTIITFLMVFMIQSTQNRDSEAMHVKLDELIRAIESANNTMLDLEDLEESDLDRIRANFQKLAAAARQAKPAEPFTDADEESER